MENLNPTFGRDESRARSINDNGDIVGYSWFTGSGSTIYGTLLLADGTIEELEHLGGNKNTPYDINNLRQVVVGTSRNASGYSRAYLWETGTISDLGTLGGDNGEALAINECRQIVGNSQIESGVWHPFIWRNGIMTDLYDYVVAGYDTPIDQIRLANINEKGEIIGLVETYDDLGRRRVSAFLLSPEDSTYYSCVGFDPPMDNGPVKVKKNKVLHLKAELRDEDGTPLTDLDITSPPVIQVDYQSVGGVAEDVTDQALPPGMGTKGNQFKYDGEKWHFNLKTKNYTAPGRYTITMVSGDDCEYIVDPTCTAVLLIE